MCQGGRALSPLSVFCASRPCELGRPDQHNLLDRSIATHHTARAVLQPLPGSFARNNSGTTIGRQAQGSIDSGVEVAALIIPRFRPDRKIYELDARSLYSQRQRERPLRHASGYIWLLQRSRFYVDTQTASHMITFVNEFRKMHFTATRVSV